MYTNEIFYIYIYLGTELLIARVTRARVTSFNSFVWIPNFIDTIVEYCNSIMSMVMHYLMKYQIIYEFFPDLTYSRSVRKNLLANRVTMKRVTARVCRFLSVCACNEEGRKVSR
jgi:hypothetical protein